MKQFEEEKVTKSNDNQKLSDPNPFNLGGEEAKNEEENDDEKLISQFISLGNISLGGTFSQKGSSIGKGGVNFKTGGSPASRNTEKRASGELGQASH